MDIERSLSAQPMTPPIFSPRAFAASIGERAIDLITFAGGMTNLTIATFRALFRHRLSVVELVHQLAFIGNRSFAIVGLTAIFTGMVFALQLAVGMGRFGLKTYIGQIVGIAILRELGPVLTCLMIAARVGSGIAAELGSMVVTEQVLAIEAMGANPMQKLVVPRLLATMIAAPILTVMADIIGVFGGSVIAISEAGVTLPFYLDQIQNTVIMEDFSSGVFKAICFGFFISMVSCYHGLSTVGGTEGVGRSTTRAVVHASMFIFVSDFFLTKLFITL